MPRLWPPSSPSTITIQEISNQEVPNQALDVDLLIDKILANDIFKEMVTQSSSETDKLVYFAKTKLDAMENELKATNEALIKEMTDKLNTAKGSFYSESVIRFTNLPIAKRKIFQINILSLKFEFVVYCYWREI